MLASASPVLLNGGSLTGNGTVNASIVNGAIVSPGSSPGTLTVNGDYTQTASGELRMELGRATTAEWDRLLIAGSATLAGSLNLTFLNPFAPSLVDAFPIVSYASHRGTFSSLTQPGLPTALALTPEYSTNALTLQVANLIGGPQTNSFVLHSSPGPLELHLPSASLAYRFQGSTNLVDWVDLSTSAPATNVFRFVDPDAIDLDRRFYRAVSP